MYSNLPPRLPGFTFFLVLLLAGLPAFAQKRPSPGDQTTETSSTTVKVCVRDIRGMPMDAPVMVRLHAVVANYDVRNPTQEGSTATFPRVKAGEYEIEIKAAGFRPTTESVSVNSFGSDFTVYVYLQKESSDPAANVAPSGVVMSPKLQNEMEKGLLAMRKQQYEQARTHFTKAAQMAPSNPDLIYLLGTAEMGLQHLDLAKVQFENALKLEPTNERALLSLGELQLQTGDLPSAIATLEKAFDANGADWKVHFLLASAYARSGRLAEAEKHATRGAALANQKGAYVYYLLGEIQFAENKIKEARETWQRIVIEFPADPVIPKVQNKLETTVNIPPQQIHETEVGVLQVQAVPMIALGPMLERPWAPLDIDSKEYRLAGNASCNIQDVMTRAQRRMNSQLNNFEKFTATERIEHQEVDRYGIPGPVRAKQFSYIVFVRPLSGDSVWLDENRLGGDDLSTFPTSLATTGLNALGVAVLQSFSTDSYNYQCEGLTSLRGEAVWQVRFEEKPGSNSSTRQWRKNGELLNIPLKGRFWLAATSYDLLRIESDLSKPVLKLDLTRDHLVVDYGPVNFESGKVRLWLPWGAEMFMELHGKRYHHKHSLTDYLLFAVDSNHKMAAPKTPPLPTADSAS
jgi:Flp pilus assembly protein TadD